MIPKGLGAAVLASLPAQQGVPGGEVIQSVVFSIILCSTLFTTILTFLVDKTYLANVYGWIFKLSGLGRVKTDDKSEEITPEEAELSEDITESEIPARILNDPPDEEDEDAPKG